MSDRGYSGALDGRSDANQFLALRFMISQAMAEIATVTLVKVIAVTNAGGVSPVGTVDVQPMVHQIDGEGKATPHGVIHGLPYVRIQGGANAIIIDPQVGDLGFAGFCSTDISSVKVNKAPAGPGSRRRFDWADGIYLGGVLGAAPTQYVQFIGGNLNIVSTGTITLQAPTVHVQGDLTVSGVTTGTGDVIGNGTHLHTHQHSGVTTGGGNTGAPI